MIIAAKVLLTSLLLVGSLGMIEPVQAEKNAFLGGTLTASVYMLNDYRRRGVSLNDESFSLQGGFDYRHNSGFYVGGWAYNISNYHGSTVETDISGGYSGKANGIGYNIGGVLLHYPKGTDADFIEIYGSTSIELGFISTTVWVIYAPSHDNLGNQDNIAIYTEGRVPVPKTPVSIYLRLGYEDGALFGNNKWDWKVGAFMNFQKLDLGIYYIDTNIPGENADATVVFSVGTSF